MIALRLALSDWIDEWATSLCLIVGVAAAAVPLLMMFSIRSGVVLQLRAELTRFPSSRELITTGQPRVSPALVAEMRRSPQVGFVAPLTRLLSASAVLRNDQTGRGVETDMVPSGPGDPLLPGPWRRHGVVIPDIVARELGAGAGDTIGMVLNRTTAHGEPETIRLAMPVTAVVPAQVYASGRRIVLVDQALLLASEIWREREDVPTLSTALDLASAPQAQRRYAGLRVYAATIDDTETVREYLLRRGIETESRIEEIRLVQRLDRGLSILLAVLAAVTMVGLTLSLAAAQWGWVERKRRDLSYLRLIGLNTASLAAIPLFQAVLTVVSGTLIAALLAVFASQLINQLFAGQLAAVSNLSLLSIWHVAIVAGLALASGVAAALLAAFNAQRVTPIEALRGM